MEDTEEHTLASGTVKAEKERQHWQDLKILLATAIGLDVNG